jgi:hypothetical protein
MRRTGNKKTHIPVADVGFVFKTADKASSAAARVTL